MARCPKCGNEIDYLEVYSHMHGIVHIDSGRIRYRWDRDSYGCHEERLEFRCPKCKEVLFDDPIDAEKDAEDFLRGND